MGQDEHPWRAVRLHIVTGKGGTGKTTIAAAVALALATKGHRVLLVEVEGRQGIARLFDTPPLPYEERQIAVGPGGGEVWALAIDPEAALLEYLEMFYNLHRAGKLLRRVGAVDFATTIAPGLRDVLLTGKTSEATQRRTKDGQPVYRAVVLDAPPTGRIARFLNVTSEMADLARVGPIRSQSDSVMRVIRSERTAVHLTTLLEEMPVQETIDGVADLRDNGLPAGGIMINMVREPGMTDDELAAAAAGTLDQNEIRAGLERAALPRHVKVDAATAALVIEAEDHAERVELEREQRERLVACHRPTYELPMIPTGVDLAGLYDLASALRTQGFV